MNLQRIVGLFRTLGNFTVAYVVLQVLTGVQTAAAAVGLVVLGGWNIGSALAFVLPLGFPMLIIQGGLFLTWYYGRRGQDLVIPESMGAMAA